MENDIKNANAAMAGELGPLARQKTEPIIDRGRALMRTLGDNSLWTSSIEQITNQLERKLNAVEALSRNRSHEVHDQQQLTSIRTWLIDIAESFMKSNGHLGATYAQANEFLARHKQFAVEVTVCEYCHYQWQLNHGATALGSQGQVGHRQINVRGE